MNTMLVSPATKTSLDAYLHSPSHGLVITGPSGSGKTYLAEFLAYNLLDVDQTKLIIHPYYIVIRPEEGKNQISIEQIRSLKQLTKLKTLGQAQIKRVIIIEQAELMGHEAQNALLKLLEEPSEDTVLILTTNDSEKLLPTIRSRLQAINAHPVNLELANNYFKVDQEQIERAWSLSAGYPGLMSSLLNRDDTHNLNIGINDAREILSLTVYERLLLIPAYTTDKLRLESMLIGLERLLSASHFSSAGRNNQIQMLKIQRARQALYKANTSIKGNGSIKLNLLYLFTEIG